MTDMDRWLFAITVVGSITYTVAQIARVVGRHRPDPAIHARSSRIPHAHPMTHAEQRRRSQ